MPNGNNQSNNNNTNNKNSARTGYNFYKNSSLQNSNQKNGGVRGGGFSYTNEESPPRLNNTNNANEQLPTLNIKVLSICVNLLIEQARKQVTHLRFIQFYKP